MSETISSAMEDSLFARPTRIAFCTRWNLDDDSFEIADEFDSISVSTFPFEISRAIPMYAIVFWEGRIVECKPKLTIETPAMQVLSVRLPALKSNFISQVEVNSLVGFWLPEAGPYRFCVTTDRFSTVRTLVVHQAPTVSIADEETYSTP
jgi:hypothetical protein